MFAKLACRNVKRQLSNYLIYFVTVTLTVSMMFAFSNLIFSKELLGYAQKIKDMQHGLIAITVVVSLIVAFVLGYASSFMLRLRKREFGTYLTVGMKRHHILIMFTAENLIIGLVALGCGILLGLFIYQGMISLVARVLELKISLGAYSLTGLLLTIGLTVGTFLLSMLSSALYLRKTSIYDLLHAEKKVMDEVKHPIIWTVITIASLAAIILGILGVYHSIIAMFSSSNADSSIGLQMFSYIAILIIGVALYHIGFAKSIMYLLLKCKRFRSKGTNTFVLRQLSGQLGANSVICAIIAVLIAATIMCTNVCFAQKATTDTNMNMDFPFDVTIDVTSLKNGAPYSYEKALNMIEAQSSIQDKISYNLYTTKSGYLYSFTPWTGARYESLHDTFIKESDFNRLITMLGYDKISLDNQFLVLTSQEHTSKCDFSKAKLSIGGKYYSLKEVTGRYPHLAKYYCLTVVPDEAVASMSVDTENVALNLTSDHFDSESLYNELSYTFTTDTGYPMTQCPVTIRALYELEENGLTAVLIASELYMAIIFVFLSTAILTMKLLSNISEDYQRFELLYKLGASRDEQKKALFRQTFTMFAFPFFLPILLSVPSAYICGKVLKLRKYEMLIPQIYSNALIIALILICLQLLYFLATYITKKKRVIQ